MARAGLSLRHRTGYLAARNPYRAAAAREEPLRQAVWSPLDSASIALNARAQAVDGNRILVMAQFFPSDLLLLQKGGRWVGKIEIVLALKNEVGRSFGDDTLDTVDLALSSGIMETAHREGIVYRKHIKRAEHATLLRIVIRDVNSGALASLTIPLKTAASSASPIHEPEKKVEPGRRPL